MALDRIPGDASLYIGGLCSLQRKDALKQARITHIVSVFRRPLPQDVPGQSHFKRLVIEVDDLTDENIIQHFPTSNAFIRQGLDAGGGVLVHCDRFSLSLPVALSFAPIQSKSRYVGVLFKISPQDISYSSVSVGFSPENGSLPHGPRNDPSRSSSSAQNRPIHHNTARYLMTNLPISAMGKSRSTTILIAYLLTQNSDLTPKTALDLIRQCRSDAEPNSGFMTQLLLYHNMRCPASPADHPVYQRWLYERDAETSRAWGRAPEKIHFSDESGASPADESIYQRWTYQCDVEATTVIRKVPNFVHFSDMHSNKTGGDVPIQVPDLNQASSSSFRCRRCRTSLATSPYLIWHTPQRPPSVALTASPAPSCAHLFLEPLSWMRAELEHGKLEGRLGCPNVKCGVNVGKYAWQGMRCSCGEWVVPAISIARGRVDEVRKR